MEWVMLVVAIILCFIIHQHRKELDELRLMQVHMYKMVCKEDFEKAKAMHYEKYGDDAE